MISAYARPFLSPTTRLHAMLAGSGGRLYAQILERLWDLKGLADGFVANLRERKIEAWFPVLLLARALPSVASHLRRKEVGKQVEWPGHMQQLFAWQGGVL